MQIITNNRKHTPILYDNSLFRAVSAIVNRFIVKTQLYSSFTNDLKRKYFFPKNVHGCRLSLFKASVSTESDNGCFLGFCLFDA